MFYFLLEPIMMYNWLLILAAVIPAVFLMVKVYRSDRIEKESGFCHALFLRIRGYIR